MTKISCSGIALVCATVALLTFHAWFSGTHSLSPVVSMASFGGLCIACSFLRAPASRAGATELISAPPPPTVAVASRPAAFVRASNLTAKDGEAIAA